MIGDEEFERRFHSGITEKTPPYKTALAFDKGAMEGLGGTELKRLSRDPVWLDKAIWIVVRLVRESNEIQKGKGSEESLAV